MLVQYIQNVIADWFQLFLNLQNKTQMLLLVHHVPTHSVCFETFADIDVFN